MKYICFLRGINVGGHRKIKMADLRESFENLGFQNVKSYIQSGNVIFEDSEKDQSLLESKITKKIKEDLTFDVPVMIRNLEEIEQTIKSIPFKKIDNPKTFYITLLSEIPSTENVKSLEELLNSNDQSKVLGSVVYTMRNPDVNKSKFSNNLVEKILKVSATNRNLNTLNKVLELMKS